MDSQKPKGLAVLIAAGPSKKKPEDDRDELIASLADEIFDDKLDKKQRMRALRAFVRSTKNG